MPVRIPAVAGEFYPGKSSSLRKTVEQLLSPEAKRTPAKGLVSPHAGYMYSGAVAGEVFSRINIPERIIILGPNHTGLGSPYSIMREGTWKMPFGNVEIDKELAERTMERTILLKHDLKAHLYEHSIEVQLPFLQYINPSIKIVPIVIGGIDIDEYREIGSVIGETIKESGSEVLIIASSDMTHYEDQETAERKDRLVIESILNLDEAEMLERVTQYNVSMCGYGPVAITLVAAKILGATKGVLIKYMTSGDVCGDYRSVVGYAGIIFP